MTGRRYGEPRNTGPRQADQHSAPVFGGRRAIHGGVRPSLGRGGVFPRVPLESLALRSLEDITLRAVCGRLVTVTAFSVGPVLPMVG